MKLRIPDSFVCQCSHVMTSHARKRRSAVRRFLLVYLITFALSPDSIAQIDVHGNGNVGIGIATPAEKLEVVGNISTMVGGFRNDVNRTVSISSWNFSARPAGWYRIASSQGDRTFATFELRENADHSTLSFNFGNSYGSSSGMSLTVLGHNRWSSATFQKIRLLRKDTYDPQYIEVYVNPHNNDNRTFFASVKNNLRNSGWDLIAFDAGSVPAGYSTVEYDVDVVFMAASYDDTASFKVARNGNVGIGLSSPSYKLQVAGSVHATSFISATTTYADFVFSPDYRLPSLAEVEAHIKQKGHLPDIPPESEARANGIDLAAMQVKLLQKIEELTLHQIAQDKRLQSQSKRIENLESENRELRAQRAY